MKTAKLIDHIYISFSSVNTASIWGPVAMILLAELVLAALFIRFKNRASTGNAVESVISRSVPTLYKTPRSSIGCL